jgi:hypothetical protein
MTGEPVNDRAGGDDPYLEYVSDETGACDAGKIVGVYGGFDFTFSGRYTNPVMYPNDAEPVNSWGEALSLALAHYYFSPRGLDGDRVGLYRSKGLAVRITMGDITDALPLPGSRVEIIIGGETYNCRVVSARENYAETETDFELECWTI